MPEHWVMFVARAAGEPDRRVADRGRPGAAARLGPLLGRHWSRPCLHFEACYYQPLSWCLANGYLRFEGGAQGEHKMARGLLPVATHSAHWLRDPRFAAAVADFLAAKARASAQYVDELRERSPFKRGLTRQTADQARRRPPRPCSWAMPLPIFFARAVRAFPAQHLDPLAGSRSL
jgi:predicted N-acyltransferase